MNAAKTKPVLFFVKKKEGHPALSSYFSDFMMPVFGVQPVIKNLAVLEKKEDIAPWQMDVLGLDEYGAPVIFLIQDAHAEETLYFSAQETRFRMAQFYRDWLAVNMLPFRNLVKKVLGEERESGMRPGASINNIRVICLAEKFSNKARIALSNRRAQPRVVNRLTGGKDLFDVELVRYAWIGDNLLSFQPDDASPTKESMSLSPEENLPPTQDKTNAGINFRHALYEFILSLGTDVHYAKAFCYRRLKTFVHICMSAEADIPILLYLKVPPSVELQPGFVEMLGHPKRRSIPLSIFGSSEAHIRFLEQQGVREVIVRNAADFERTKAFIEYAYHDDGSNFLES
jgi:hypothetical protein